jgi:hypothetical protein
MYKKLVINTDIITYKYTQISINIYVSINICAYVWIHMNIYKYMYLNTYIYIYIYIPLQVRRRSDPPPQTYVIYINTHLYHIKIHTLTYKKLNLYVIYTQIWM